MINYIASYPRSGNTLLRIILWRCFGIKTSSVYEERAFRRQLKPVLECDSNSIWRKTHWMWDGTAGQHIYIERDVDHVKNSVEAFYKHHYSFAEVESSFQSHQDHMRSWKQADPLWLHFEDLLATDTLDRLSSHLGQDPIHGLDAVPSFADLKRLHPAFFRAGTGLHKS